MSHTPADALLPPPVSLLVAEAFDGAPLTEIAPTSGGFSNITCYATIDQQRCVVKAARLAAKRADVRREAYVLSTLRARGLSIPTLLALVEDADWSVVVTEALSGRNGLQLLATEPNELERVYASLGHVLSAVHNVMLSSKDTDLLLLERLRQTQATLETLPLEPGLRTTLHASLAQAIWHTESPRLVHGDVGLHNLLWHNKVWLLDWEWSSIGQPLLDLAWLRWTLHWRHLPEALWQRFLTAYLAHNSGVTLPEPDAMRALMLGQIATILARVSDQPEAFAEWERRAVWTQALPLGTIMESV